MLTYRTRSNKSNCPRIPLRCISERQTTQTTTMISGIISFNRNRTRQNKSKNNVYITKYANREKKEKELGVTKRYRVLESIYECLLGSRIGKNNHRDVSEPTIGPSGLSGPSDGHITISKTSTRLEKVSDYNSLREQTENEEVRFEVTRRDIDLNYWESEYDTDINDTTSWDDSEFVNVVGDIECKYRDRTKRNKLKSLEHIISGYRSSFPRVVKFYIDIPKSNDYGYIYRKMRSICIQKTKLCDGNYVDPPQLSVAVKTLDSKILCLALWNRKDIPFM